LLAWFINGRHHYFGGIHRPVAMHKSLPIDIETCCLMRRLRDYYMTFSISALVSARNSNIKPDSKTGGLIPGTIWKISCNNLFITYFTSTFFKHWLLYCRKDLWTDKLTNKFLRELSLFNLQILFRLWFQNDIKQCRSV
jgi:hypothetical protein